MQPFGVALDWRPPLVETDTYWEIVLAQDVTASLLRYSVAAKQIIIKAMHDVLREAGFQVLMDHEERNSYIYRVLAAPRFPLG